MMFIRDINYYLEFIFVLESIPDMLRHSILELAMIPVLIALSSSGVRADSLGTSGRIEGRSAVNKFYSKSYLSFTSGKKRSSRMAQCFPGGGGDGTSNCNGPCQTGDDCDGQLTCINGSCNDDPDIGTNICSGSKKRI